MPTDKELLDEVYANYPQYAPFLNIPEIRSVLIKAAREDWADARLEGAIRKTKYWQTHSQKQLEWPMLSAEEKKERIKQESANALQMLIQYYGLEWIKANRPEWLDPSKGQAYHIGNRVAQGRDTFEEWRMKQYLHASKQRGTPAFEEVERRKLRPEEKAEELIQIARNQYWLDFTEKDALKWGKLIIDGVNSEHDFMNFIRERATKTYGHDEMIEKGITPSEFFSDYMNLASRLLEKDSDTILAHGKVMPQLRRWAVKDEMPNLWDFERFVKSQNEWKNTSNAMEEVTDITKELSRRMGRG